MKYIKTTSFGALLIGILMACCFQYLRNAGGYPTVYSEFLSKNYSLDSYKANKLPALPIHITRVYRKYRAKSLHVNFHFISDNHFILIEQDPGTFLSWSYAQNIPSSFLLFQGSRAPPAVC